jgi:8-oxo-dGTP pyrophosphatase MutT (NUDIX family)
VRRLLLIFGRIIYWVGWPVSFASLYFTKRSRVLIVCGQEVLVVKGWLGSGHWHTPGGGIHKGEAPVDGAMREVQEEIGLTVKPEQLQQLFHKRITTRRFFRYDCYAFVLLLLVKPELKLQPNEIIDSAWLPLEAIRRQEAGKITSEMLAAWEQQT